MLTDNQIERLRQAIVATIASPVIGSIEDYTWDDRTIILWHLDVDSLLVRGCNWAHDYLNNPNADLSEEDRHVCDGITTQNHP